jgi:hypothetical protein
VDSRRESKEGEDTESVYFFIFSIE